MFSLGILVNGVLLKEVEPTNPVAKGSGESNHLDATSATKHYKLRLRDTDDVIRAIK